MGSMKHSSNPRWSLHWQQLAVMIGAGLSVEKGLHTLLKAEAKTNSERKIKITIERVKGLVQRGVSLTSAMQRAGAINKFDGVMLQTAEIAGRLPDGLNAIAQRRLKQIQRVDALSNAFWLPQCVLIIAALSAAFIRVSRGEGVLSTCVEVGFWLIVIRIATRLFLALLRLDPRVYLSALWPFNWLRKNSELFQIGFELTFYSAFLWQVRGGLDVQQATENCQNLLSNHSFKYSTMRAAHSMGKGIGVTDSLSQHGLILSKRLSMTVSIAEESGRWEQAIEHELGLQAAIITQSIDAKFKWIPRVYYVIVLLIGFRLMA